MGGASSFYAMLAVAGFLVAVWFSGKVSKVIGVSSIVLEVATGVLLGPQVLGLIPSELSECYTKKSSKCTVSIAERNIIASEGWEYCDLGAYLEADKYTKGNWNEGWWGSQEIVSLKTKKDEPDKTYCINPFTNVAPCELFGTYNNGLRRRLDANDSAVVRTEDRRLGSDKKGKTDYDDYDQCLVESCQLKVALECATVPDIFTLVGHTGVAMMIFESGLHFDFEQAQTVGPWASLVAVFGTFLPLASGVGLAKLYGFDVYPDGLSVGVSLAPTSVGIALKLLHEAQALQTYFGQAVMTAAFIDDVLSLILFSVLFSLGGDMTFMSFFPLIMGCVFMVVAIVAAVKVWPVFIRWFFSKVPEYKPNAKVTTHDEFMWMLMFGTLAAYAQITHLCGTHLWGCFIAGMSFATQRHAHHVWVKQVKRFTCWWLRIFFACTLAWSIPITKLFSLDAFWKGTIMGIGPCILTKVLCAPFMGDSKWVIGWAMVGRAEFAYFISILAKSMKMMEEDLFAILVWALLYATIFAPLIFRIVLQRYMETSMDDTTIMNDDDGVLESEASTKRRPSTKTSMTISTVVSGLRSKVNDASGHLPDTVADELERELTEIRIQRKSRTITPDFKDEAIRNLQAELAAKEAEHQRLLEEIQAMHASGYSNGNGAKTSVDECEFPAASTEEISEYISPI